MRGIGVDTTLPLVAPSAPFARRAKGIRKGSLPPHPPGDFCSLPTPVPLLFRYASFDNGLIDNEDGIMTPEELQALTVYRDFPKTGKALIYRIGLPAAAALIGRYPGQQYLVPAAGNHQHPYHVAKVKELVEMMGADAAERLMVYFGGCNLYVPSCRNARAAQRSEAIIAEYEQLLRDGLSSNRATMDLGLKHGVSGRAIERVVNNPTHYRRQDDE
jgi:Mor family transcriptional regulator